MKNTYFANQFVTASIACLLSIAAHAEPDSSSKHAVGANLNNFGLGLSYTYKLNDQLHIRSTLSGLTFNEGDIEYSDIDYEGDLDSQAASVSLNWYPMSEGWKRRVYISGGLSTSKQDFEGKATAKIGETLNIGGSQVSANSLQDLSLSIENETDIAPFLSIGWGNKIAGERGFAFNGELGVIFLDDSSVNLTSAPSGAIPVTALERERQDIIDEDAFGGTAGFVSIGLSYHF